MYTYNKYLKENVLFNKFKILMYKSNMYGTVYAFNKKNKK